jgi:hypothetical protein
MGDPIYDAQQAAKRAAAERERAFEETGKAAIEAVAEFFAGTAKLGITRTDTNGWVIQLIRAPKP